MGTLLGNMEGCSLTRDSEGKIKRRYIKRDLKMPCKWISLYIWALLGNLEGIHLLGHLSEKGSISEFLSWTQRTMRL
jgi:REP element-mobilizing transposase RayT